ncbi:MAG: ABC transporter substrate-binding protein [Oscillospiraceae bacterium]|nr:ABC transporter substrate-binding protein [Oscillospiraceae bacterium]
MKFKLKRLTALLMAAVMLLGCTGCGASEEDDEQVLLESTGGKDIVRAKAADNVFSLNFNSNYSLNPIIATNHANQLVCSLVYENMVEVDNDFNVIPNIIKEWSPNEDGTMWTFKIDVEANHTFHDGTPVTGKDLRYSIERAITADRYKGRFASFQGASYTEDTLYVSLGIGDMQFHKLMNIPVIKYGTYPDKRPIGSGPYAYNEEGTELHAFEGYHNYESLPVDTVYLKEYPTADGTISAFEDSYIDVVINDPSSYTNLGYASTNEIHTFATTNLHYVAFNEESPLGRQSYFRYAMQFAFKRSKLVELLNGNAVASSVPLYPTVDFYPEDLAKTLNYNLDMCKQILENVGIKDYDEDGWLEYMSGTPQEIDVNFIVASDSSAKNGVVNQFAEDMESLGVKVTVHSLTWDDYVLALQEGKTADGTAWDMYYGEIKLRNNFDLTELLQVRDEDNENTNLNFTRSRDMSVEAYINQYLGAGDGSRATAYKQLCDYITTTAASLITIGFEKQQIITHRGVVKGVDANIGNPLYGFDSWQIFLD